MPVFQAKVEEGKGEVEAGNKEGMSLNSNQLPILTKDTKAGNEKAVSVVRIGDHHRHYHDHLNHLHGMCCTPWCLHILKVCQSTTMEQGSQRQVEQLHKGFNLRLLLYLLEGDNTGLSQMKETSLEKAKLYLE